MVTIKEKQQSDVRGNARQNNGVRDNARSKVNVEKLQSFFNSKNNKKENKKYKNKNKNEKSDLDMKLFRCKNMRVSMEKIQNFFDLKNKNENKKNKNKNKNEVNCLDMEFSFYKKYKNQNKNEKIDLDMELFRYKKNENKNMYACSSYTYFGFSDIVQPEQRLKIQSGEMDYVLVEDVNSFEIINNVFKKGSFSTKIPEHEQRSLYYVRPHQKYYINKFGDLVVTNNNRKNKKKNGKNKKNNFKLQSGFIAEKLLQYHSDFNERYIIKLIDDVLCFFKYATETVIGMTRIQIIIRAVLNFLKLRFNESTYHIIKDNTLPYINSILSNLDVQNFEENLDNIRAGLSGMKNIFSSPIVSKLHQCTLYMISLSIFEKLGISMDFLNYSVMEKAALKRKYSNVSSFFYVLCETILFIVERGYQVYKTGDISTIFHSGGQYKKVYDSCRDLTRKLPLLSNPEDHGFTESGFRAELDDTIEKLISIDKYSYCLNSSEKTVIKETLNKMLMMRDDLNTRSAARRNRKAPFGILIYGDSGIGKTTVTAMLATYFAKHENLSTKSEFRYTVNPAAKYWDGFVTSCHTLILDDVANEHPDLKDSKSLDNIIQVMNNQAFCPDQASLENKGNTPFKGKLVIATTNVKHLNAYSYFSCPSAAQRRFPFIITPKPKKEYLDSRGMLSTKNVECSAYPSLWLFDIDLVVPVPASQGRVYAKLERLHNNLETKGLLEWFHIAIEKFNADQKKVKKCIDLMETEPLCMCCTLPDSLCQNLLAPQSGDMVVGISLIGLVTCMFLYTTNYMLIRTYFEMYCKIRNFCYSYVAKREAILREVNKISTAQFWMNMGNKVQNSFKNKVVLTAIMTAIVATLTVYKITNPKDSLDIQGDVSENIGQRPKEEENGRENVWYNNNFELSSANFTRESASSKSCTFEEFCKKISNNVIFVATHISDDRAVTGKLLGLGGHIYLTNNHSIPDCKVSRTCTLISSSKLGLNSNTHIILSEDDIYRIPEKDLAFVFIRELPPKKKITQYFMTETSAGVFNGKYMSKSSKGEDIEYILSNIQLQKKTKFKCSEKNIDCSLTLWKAYSNKPTLYGDCGAPMIVKSDFGYSILGIHMLIDTTQENHVFANAIDGKFINTVYKTLSSLNTQAGDFDMISSDSVQRPVVDLHKKSVFRYMNEGTIDVYGSFTDFRGKTKSKVVDTPMSKVLPKEYKKKYTAPEMTTYEPWRIAAMDLVKPIRLDTHILNKCTKGYMNNIISRMNPENITMLMVLDDFTAINGAMVAYIDKINRNTSAGNPWKKSKKYFLESTPPEHGMLDPVKISSEEMNNRIDKIILTYLEGKRCNPNFCAHLKDEPVTFKKAKMKKTRVFTGAPFDWCVVVRKYLLSFCRLLQNERFAFEAAPGTIAQSLEWQELYTEITKYGKDRIVAGDYKAYDKRMSPKEILAAFDVIIYFCKLSKNYTDDDIKVIRGIAEDTAFSVVDFNGDLVQMFGSNPSGNPLTVILNSIVNSLRMRYVYILLNPENEVDDFIDNVALMTYGDDNIMSVHKKCDWFNHTTISKKFAELDIVYTMADKEAESVPFIHIDDASFLKRKWRYDEDMKCMLAPLDHESIEKMLMVWVKSKSVTEEYQGVSVLCTALQEYFFYGKSIFNEKRPMLVNLVKKLGWSDYVNAETFPTYEDLVTRFINSSSKCKSFEECYEV
jgi:hypothetical protein